MPKNHIYKIFNFLLLAFLPLLAGCGGGGSSSLVGLGSLFAGGGGGSGFVGGDGGAGPDLGFSGGGVDIATISGPEPASLLLLGGGIAAISYLKNRITTKI